MSDPLPPLTWRDRLRFGVAARPVDLDAHGDHDHEGLLADLHARMAAELEADA